MTSQLACKLLLHVVFSARPTGHALTLPRPRDSLTNTNSPYRFINNEWVEGVDKKKFEVINPSTEEVITSVCEATEKDVDLAVAAARKAFETTWKETTPANRGVLMNKLADIAEKNTDLLAAVESLDNGKSITMAKGDVGAVVACIRYYAGWSDKIHGKTVDVAPDMHHTVRKEPVRTMMSLNTDTSRDANCEYRLVSAVKSSPGTSLFSCFPGRLALPWPLATPSS